MFERRERRSWSVSQLWILILGVVIILLFAIQVLRVNRRKSVDVPEEVPVVYTAAGPLVSGQVTIRPHESQSYKINLNRRAKLTGTFQTGSVKKRVAIVVIKESDLDAWTAASRVVLPVVGTGYVPGGKISPTLEPGAYILIIDGRQNDEPINVSANFAVE